LLALLALTVGLRAGPPYATDDPEPVEPGHVEIFVAALASAEAGDATGAAPQLQVNYGAVQDVQLSVAPQLSFSRPGPGPTTYGWGDTQAGVKFRFLHEDGARPQAAVFPQVTLPSGDAGRGLGSGAVQWLLPLWLQKSWGPWTSFGGGGYWFNPGAGQRNWTFIGAALQRDIGERWSLGGELFFHSAAQVDDVDGLGANAAFLWHCTPQENLVFSAGRDLVWGRTTFTGFGALQVVL
jgi:hypothetical protein